MIIIWWPYWIFTYITGADTLEGHLLVCASFYNKMYLINSRFIKQTYHFLTHSHHTKYLWCIYLVCYLMFHPLKILNMIFFNVPYNVINYYLSNTELNITWYSPYRYLQPLSTENPLRRRQTRLWPHQRNRRYHDRTPQRTRVRVWSWKVWRFGFEERRRGLSTVYVTVGKYQGYFEAKDVCKIVKKGQWIKPNETKF